MPYFAGRMLASKIAYSARNSAGRIYPAYCSHAFSRAGRSKYRKKLTLAVVLLTLCDWFKTRATFSSNPK